MEDKLVRELSVEDLLICVLERVGSLEKINELLKEFEKALTEEEEWIIEEK